MDVYMVWTCMILPLTDLYFLDMTCLAKCEATKMFKNDQVTNLKIFHEDKVLLDPNTLTFISYETPDGATNHQGARLLLF